MSQPKRYTIRGIIASDGNAYAEESVSPSGIWVEYDDYAALAAENERLRKAGDDVVSKIEVCSENLWCAIHRWNAAKEGRDAK